MKKTEFIAYAFFQNGESCYRICESKKIAEDELAKIIRTRGNESVRAGWCDIKNRLSDKLLFRKLGIAV